MKIIIKGKLYDTETAQKLLTLNEPCYWGTYTEMLYKKKNGEFFLYAPEQIKHDTSYGDAYYYFNCVLPEHLQHEIDYDMIRHFLPITETFAKDWTEKNFTVEEYIQIWGTPEE